MKNYTTTRKYAKGLAIIRYEEGQFLCPKGHEVGRTNDDFFCKTCREVYQINK